MRSLVIHEVGMRDGLQIEKQIVPLELKKSWLEKLLNSGIEVLQIGSFVHPEKVPQMKTTDDLFSHLSCLEGRKTLLSGLVLNERGLERGLKCGVELFCMGVSASETHSRKNTGMSTDEALQRIMNMADIALAENKRVQLSVQSAFGCGFEGVIPPERVLSILEKYLARGFMDISLADTAGKADPRQTVKLVEDVYKLSESFNITCHFHNTYGAGVANCLAAWDSGVSTFETAFGGLGGCPFTKTTGGNVCTEDLVNLFRRMKISTSIDISPLINVTREAADFFGREMSGCLYKTVPAEK
jgi:hydroxymethylglutaryl-CoA lyase